MAQPWVSFLNPGTARGLFLNPRCSPGSSLRRVCPHPSPRPFPCRRESMRQIGTASWTPAPEMTGNGTSPLLTQIPLPTNREGCAAAVMQDSISRTVHRTPRAARGQASTKNSPRPLPTRIITPRKELNFKPPLHAQITRQATQNHRLHRADDPAGNRDQRRRSRHRLPMPRLLQFRSQEPTNAYQRHPRTSAREPADRHFTRSASAIASRENRNRRRRGLHARALGSRDGL